MLFLWQLVGLLTWLMAISILQVAMGGAAGLKGVLLTGALALLSFVPLTDAIFGTAIGDADAAIGAGIFWTVNIVLWLLALAGFYFMALPRPHAVSPRNKN